MSLLLDALKKSDEERRALEIASLRNLPISAAPSAPKPMRILPLLLLIALLGGGYLAYGQWLAASAAREAAVLEADQQRLEASRKREAERREARAQADQTALREELKQQQMATTQRPSSNEAMLQAIAANGNPNIINNSETFGAAVPQTGAVTKTAPELSQPAPPQPPSMPVVGDNTEMPKAADAVAANAAPSEAPAMNPPIDAPNKLPRAYELPFGARQALPNTTLNMHVYAREPAQRVVMINMESGREGTMLKTGLVIREITPVGVVVEYQGTEFFIDP